MVGPIHSVLSKKILFTITTPVFQHFNATEWEQRITALQKCSKIKSRWQRLILGPYSQRLLPLCSFDSLLFNPPSSLSCTRFLLLFWRAICFQRGRSEWVRAGGSVSVSSLDMFRLKPFAPRNSLLWTQTAAGPLVSSGGNLQCFEHAGGFFFSPFPLFLWRHISPNFWIEIFLSPLLDFYEMGNHLLVEVWFVLMRRVQLAVNCGGLSNLILHLKKNV